VRYVIDGITGPLGALVHGARGSFDFISHDDATTVEWTYVYLPRSPLYAPFVAFVIGVFWRRYMVRALATALADVEARAAGAPGAPASERRDRASHARIAAKVEGMLNRREDMG
jgi:hypothetical protein